MIARLQAALDAKKTAVFDEDTIKESLDSIILRNASFRHATLAKVDFSRADVTDATFRDADLREADLSKVEGLIPEQLAGADLTRCKLPDDVKGFSQLENVKEISKNAGALFLTMILACVFVLITIVSTRDMQLLTNTGTAQLPVLNVAVATPVFFTVSPIVLIMLYATVHLYLQRLWALMAALPAVFPDGTRVERKTYPWLLNDLIQAAFVRLRPRGWAWVFDQPRLFAFVAYNLVPFTVGIVWLRYLAKHDADLSRWQAVFFLVAVLLGPLMKASHWRTMGEPFRRASLRLLSVLFALALAAFPFFINQAVQSGIPPVSNTSVAQISTMRYIGLIEQSDKSAEGNSFSSRIDRLHALIDGEGKALSRIQKAINAATDARDALRKSEPYERRELEALGTPPFAMGFGDLTEDLSRRPEKWEQPTLPSLEPDEAEKAQLTVGKSGPYHQRLENAVFDLRDTVRYTMNVSRSAFVRTGNETQRPNLRFLRARGAFLVDSDFRGADLTGADLSEADLRGSLWWDPTVNLDNPEHSGRSVDLSFAVLSFANLTGTDLGYATLTGADLSYVMLLGATLDSAMLTDVSLTHAILTGASLNDATLIGADLNYATLTGADLTQTALTGADLTQTTMMGADLTKAALSGADLTQAAMKGCLSLESAAIAGAGFKADQPPSSWPKGWTLDLKKGILTFAGKGKPSVKYRLVPGTIRGKEGYLVLRRTE